MSKEHDPQKIQEKIDAGLTREQAIAALDRQAAHDAPPAGKEKKLSKSRIRRQQVTHPIQHFAAGTLTPRGQ